MGRLYKAKDGWKKSASLDREDLLLTAKALNEAHTWILAKEATQGLIELRSIDEADSAEEVA